MRAGQGVKLDVCEIGEHTFVANIYKKAVPHLISYIDNLKI
jgi:hypothetical protein